MKDKNVDLVNKRRIRAWLIFFIALVFAAPKGVGAIARRYEVIYLSNPAATPSQNTSQHQNATLRGDEAIAHLKQQGQYESLRTAMAASLELEAGGAAPSITIDLPLAMQRKLTASDGAANDEFGNSIAISGDTLVAGADLDDIGANANQGSAYVFVRSGANWSQQTKLSAKDGAANDWFGASVAINGDTVVVGANRDAVSANANQGSAYVFVRDGTSWSQQAKLTASDGAANDWFGASVAISGDTVVIGASGDDNSANMNQGSAYVFVRKNASWSQQQKLFAGDGAANDGFGNSVAVSGATVVVGAGLDDIAANPDQGSAYVFVRSETNWSQQAKLIAEDGAARDQFGHSVAISGNSVVVGAHLDDWFQGSSFALDRGSAYVFVRSGKYWNQQQKLTAGDGGSGDNFGISVAIGGDTLVVGAERDTIGANLDQGSVYTFVRSGASWSQQTKLTASDGANGDLFGSSVAISGDRVMVGADRDVIGANIDQGSVYVFSACGNLVEQQKLSPSIYLSDFGVSVAISGDTVVVGDPGDRSFFVGSVSIFVRSGTSWSLQAKLRPSDCYGEFRCSEYFGRQVAISGDTVVVGGGHENIYDWDDQGRLHVFVRSGTTWSLQQMLTASDGGYQDNFGFSLAISGDTIVASAMPDLLENSVYVFARIGTNWSQQAKLIGDKVDGYYHEYFGHHVAISGNTVVVTSRQFRNITTGAGTDFTYVFVRSGASWRKQATLATRNLTGGDSFESVAISDNTLVVGAPTDTRWRGAAYIFVRSQTGWSLQAKITAGDGEAYEGLGNPVAISGDTVVVRAARANIPPSVSQESAYVFVRNGTSWSQQSKLTASDDVTSLGFGNSIAISGSTVVAGTRRFSADREQGAAYIFACSGCPTISPEGVPKGTVGSSYNQTITATSGVPPYRFLISEGGLPPGLTLNGTTGVLSGTPTSAGTYRFTMAVTDADLCASSRSYALLVTRPVGPRQPPFGRTRPTRRSFGIERSP